MIKNFMAFVEMGFGEIYILTIVTLASKEVVS